MKGVDFLDYIKLGKKVRIKRKSKGLTQEQLAEQSGISLSFLGHIERGSRKASLETLVSIANALGVSPDYLLQDSLIRRTNYGYFQNTSQSEAVSEIVRVILDKAPYLNLGEEESKKRE